MSNIKNEIDAIKDIESIYGHDIAENVEKIYRLETNNFKSLQYENSGSAGMLKHSESFPYGWTSISKLWSTKHLFAPKYQTWNFTKPDSETGLLKVYKYLVFDNFGGFYSLAEFLKHYGNNAGRWYSTDEQKQAEYMDILINFDAKYLNS